MLLEHRHRRAMRLGLTPMIDVVFLLLLFFMLSSTFLDQRHLVIEATGTTTGISDDGDAVVVRIDAHGIWIGERGVRADEVVAALEAGAAGDRARPILVRPDGSVTLQRLVDVLETIDGGGFATVSLQTVDQE